MLSGRRRWWAGGVVALGATTVVVGWWSGAYNRCRLAYYLHAGRASLEAFRAKEALDDFEMAAVLAPDSAEVQYLLGVANRRTDHLSSAESCFKRAASLGWSGAEIKRQRMLTAFQACEFADSEQYLAKLLLNGTSDEVALEVYEAIAKGCLASYRLRDALVCLEHWITWRPNDVAPHFWRAAVKNTLHDSAGEAAELATVLKLDPDHLEARFRYAESLKEMNQIREAVEQYRICHQRQPNDLRYTVPLAKNQLRLGQREEARALLSGELPADADEDLVAAVWWILGELDLEDKRYDAAVERLSRAVKIMPQNSPAQYSLGRALVRLGRKKEADEHFALSDKYTEVNSQLGEVNRKIVDAPNDPSLRVQAARLLIEKGNREEALPLLLSAVQINPQEIEAHRELASLYEAKGDAKLAELHRNAAEHPETVGRKKMWSSELFAADR